MKQRANPKLGMLLVTYSGIMSWLGGYSAFGMVLLVWKVYQDTILQFLPWFNFIWMFMIALIPVMVVGLLEIFSFQPSRVAYANEQGYKHDSPVRVDLELSLENDEIIIENQRKIMEKLGIDDKTHQKTN